MIRKTTLLFIAIIVCFQLQKSAAQDIHFSQYYLSPLTQNPALTGSFPELYRVSAIYRDQWYKVSNEPFHTTAVSFDMAKKKDKWIVKGTKPKDENYLGLGGMIYYDQNGVGKLTNLTFAFSIGYHIYLGSNNRISFGAQAGYSQRKIDYSKLLVNNQYNTTSGVFDNTLANNENFNSNKTSYPALNAGFAWNHSFLNPRLKSYFGMQGNNLIRPKESLLKGDNKLAIRFGSYFALDYVLNPKMLLRTMLAFQLQAKDQELNNGLLLSVRPTSNKYTMFFGVQARTSITNKNFDALFPSVGIKYKKVRVGVSYDVNMSALRKASTYQGGPEIGVIYTTGTTKIHEVNRTIPCDIL